eukprot:CAMPEP_0184540520 /NCGR_PEP_ID=MMETSP0199_2-20130426/685_1 /TAXON_ID=1112570 /ORGANISM="Thraustochytrium sp., Strain LLF1b" /LENGTH=635 /DNA_ID=CAMNT_0026934125 /DNA_START=176 /DNA_END=2083 /DNA_ORIENTATION=-
MIGKAVLGVLATIAVAAANGEEIKGLDLDTYDPINMVEGEVARNLGKKKSNDPYSPNFVPTPYKKCPKPLGGRTAGDRYCESVFQELPACGCKEVCHIWGDPHVSPFFSACSEVSMHKPGMYTLYELPPNDNEYRQPIKIQGEVEKLKNKKSGATVGKFVTALYITYDNTEEGEDDNNLTPNEYMFDGVTPVFSAADCDENVNTDFQHYFPLYVNPTNDSQLVMLRVRANCNAKHYDAHKTYHLNTTIEFLDQLTGAEDENVNNLLNLAADRSAGSRARTYSMPDSTSIFPDDSGVCVDPLGYDNSQSYTTKKNPVPFWLMNEECKRPSGLSDGRVCGCSQQCAAFGDPHIFAFNEVPKLSNSFKADTTRPEFRVLYSVAPYYSAVVEVNDCNFIVGFYGVYLKSDAGTDLTDPENYDVAYYNAAEECDTLETVSPATRKKVHAPQQVVVQTTGVASINARAYDHALKGFNAGTFLVDNKGSTTAVPRKFESNVKDFVTAQSSETASVLLAGGVQAILKCHASEPDKNGEMMKYFNACIMRTDINVDPAPTDDSRRVLSGKLSKDPGTGGLLAIEQALQSDGWCATGEGLKYNKRKATFKKYKHRSKPAKQVKTFPYNPEMAKFCELNPKEKRCK